MNVYKVTFTYAAPNGFLRSGAIILDAENETAARVIAQANIQAHRHAVITKVALYGTQNELPLENTTGQKAKK